MSFADIPQVLALNRVERLYLGGSGLDRWQNLEVREDGHNSEEFIVSTVPYIGPGVPINHGISRAKYNGKMVSLDEMICYNEKEFLGTGYVGKTGGHLGVLARVGDSAERLIIQCHPTDMFARVNLHVLFGKTEAWYILSTRTESGYCYAGLKKGVTKAAFEQAFRNADSDAMLDMMHKVDFKKGDMVLIPSGMLHGMGPNVTFLEFHQPCDYTLRFEKNYSGRQISEEELHCGLGVEKLMESVDFTTYSREELLSIVKPENPGTVVKQGGQVETLLSHEVNHSFRVDRAVIFSTMRFRQNTDSHCIMIAAGGNIRIHNDKGSWELLQGRGAVIPSCAGDMELSGNGAELLVAYPFIVEKEVSYGLFV